ncbi:MAG: flagellar hook-length control protein FliK [Desulfuromonadales bacterium]|nr:MAG: flagellar hook-length control protein FliK [Desulfuromonadales bacterium]
MEIMQMLQVIPQAIPPTGTAPETPAGSTATADLFASLMAGLLIQPATTTASAELPSLPVEAAAQDDQQGTAPQSADIATTETAMMSLAALIPPPPTVQLAVPVTETPLPTGTTIEATTVASLQPVPAQTAPLQTEPTKAEAVIPPPDTPRETTPAPVDAVKAAPTQPDTRTDIVSAPVKEQVEVLQVTLEPAKTSEAPPAKPQAPASAPVTETAPAPEMVAADKPVPRTTGPAAAYPDRIPAIPKRVDTPVPAATAERAEAAETAGQTETAPLAGVKPQEVEVVIGSGAEERQSAGEQGKGGGQTADTKALAAPVQSDAVKSFEPTLQGTTKTEHQSSHGLRDSIMAQVKEGIAHREPSGNGQIAIRLNPAELGELRINVQVVDQHVKVEVLAANSQVRDILLGNLDSLKENFSRQNLTMTGFDVSTGTGQGFDQFFREGRATGQGTTKTLYTQGMMEEDETTAVQAVESFYYTDRRDSILDVRL